MKVTIDDLTWTVDCAGITFPEGETCESTCESLNKIGTDCEIVEGRMVITTHTGHTAALTPQLVLHNAIEVETGSNTSTSVGVEPLPGMVAVSAGAGTFVEVSDFLGTAALGGCMGPCVVEVSTEQGLLIQAGSGEAPGQLLLEHQGS
ncbi:MAG: hypothetical protein K0V04_40695 [Deltaproteobacteria bacterium]|nr:hypothetical protein [Deltaproteobacteria bacterium]